jgi:hypothetical protein
MGWREIDGALTLGGVVVYAAVARRPGLPG